MKSKTYRATRQDRKSGVIAGKSTRLVSALGSEFHIGLSLKHINVGHVEQGKPLLEFNGQAAEFMNAEGIYETHISLAAEQEYAVACVTLIKNGISL